MHINEISPHTCQNDYYQEVKRFKLGEDVEKGNPGYVIGENVNLYKICHYRKQYGVFSKKLEIKLPYDPTIPLLSIYPKKIKTLT